jgi:hypothetical protein
MGTLPGTIDRMHDHRIFGRLKGSLRAIPLTLALVSTGAAGLSASGCRVKEDDLHRWETTQHGPEKLRAVLKFPKYAMPLRIDAAVSLIRMKPRSGRLVGIDTLVDTVAEIPPDDRAQVIAGLVPVIVTELQKAPPPAQAGQAAPPDGSFAFKDAAYALLTYDKQTLISDEGMKTQLKQNLITWAMADFERRLENRTQKFGMEQLLRMLGKESVAGLPKLINRDSRNLEKMAMLIEQLADDATKEAAGVALVEIAKYVMSDERMKVTTPRLEQINKASKLEPTPAQFKAQIERYQDEELFRMLGSIKRVGGRASVDFCLAQASDPKAKMERRQGMLAALEQRLDAKNADDVKKIFDLAKSDAPAEVLDQAFRRIGEMPRDAVVTKLYEVFATDKWRVRNAAATLVLNLAKSPAHLDEFMAKLPSDRNVKGFAMTESFTYGATLARLKDVKDTAIKEADILNAVKKYLAPEATPVQRTIAGAYYYWNGTEADLTALAAFEADKSPVPVCETDGECKWVCEVPKEGSAEFVKTDIKSFGDYVKLCVNPMIKRRADEAKAAKNAPKDAPKDAQPKKDEKK